MCPKNSTEKKDKLNEWSSKKISVGGAILFSFFFVDLAVFFVLIQSFDFSSFFCWFNHPTNGQFFICVFVFVKYNCCVDTNSIQREEKKQQCKCQKLVKTFRIKKVPSKRNVFDDVIGWLSSVCNNVLYLTTQVVKRKRHLYWVLLNDCFWQHF